MRGRDCAGIAWHAAIKLLFAYLSVSDVSSFAPVICKLGGAARQGLFQVEKEITESYSYMAEEPQCDLRAGAAGELPL